MRILLIKDEDVSILLDKLKLSKFQQGEYDEQKKQELDDMHRRFHYEVTRWFQDQGYTHGH